ncbi:MAG: gluconate 2-dehydrogenase subunit 3 family protein [Geminicoccaceae bacterium]|nr:gluconate 2-dehydrogenase subunit 3 family protein [Geminicoccaceae bacterium]
MSETFLAPYPDYDVLAKWDTPSWNEQTREVMAHRLREVPGRRFFDEEEWAVLVAVCERVVPQPERAEPVPIAPWIDAALFEGRGTGTHFATLPSGPEAWRRGLESIDREARARHGCGFAALDATRRDDILEAVDAGDVDAAIWRDLPARTFFRHLLLEQIVALYYVHPDAQSEIGFGGPASPRGYVRLGPDRLDEWEAPAAAKRP